MVSRVPCHGRVDGKGYIRIRVRAGEMGRRNGQEKWAGEMGRRNGQEKWAGEMGRRNGQVLVLTC